jgi:hypothetical protein
MGLRFPSQWCYSTVRLLFALSAVVSTVCRSRYRLYGSQNDLATMTVLMNAVCCFASTIRSFVAGSLLVAKVPCLYQHHWNAANAVLLLSSLLLIVAKFISITALSQNLLYYSITLLLQLGLPSWNCH